MIKVKVDIAMEAREEILFSWNLFCRDFELPWEEVTEKPDLVIGTGKSDDICVSKDFIEKIGQSDFNPNSWFPTIPKLVNVNSDTDVLGTVFYYVNSLQEYNSDEVDQYGRYSYSASLQHKYPQTNTNYVGKLFLELYASIKSKIPTGHTPPSHPSYVFLSHDIDRVTTGHLEDGLFAVKKFDLPQAVRLSIAWLRGKKRWSNFEHIVNLNNDKILNSTFFIIPKRGKDSSSIINADYRLSDSFIQNGMRHILDSGHHIGLHKSTLPSSLDEERKLLPNNPIVNRNHFLKINLPEHYDKVESSGIQIDCSLGFAEVPGFRNSYGLPFKPFNFKTRKPYSFIEVPLNIMDVSFYTYKKLSPEKSFPVIEQILKNNKTNTVISLLWHNNFISPGKYGEWKELYSSVLGELKKLGFQSLSPDDILKKFG